MIIYKIIFDTSIFYFCNEENFIEFEQINYENNYHTYEKFITNLYIYEDDTITEIINKIKLVLIQFLDDFKTKDLNEINGYLYTNDWNYYSTYKIQEFLKNINVSLNKSILNRINCEIINETKKNKFIIDNIKLNNTKSLVIGYFYRNIENNFKYYINPEYFNSLIDKNYLLDNEYNKTINYYKNFQPDYTYQNITTFYFKLVNNNNFTMLNTFSLLNNDLTNLKNIYTKLDKNRELINNKYNVLNNISFINKDNFKDNLFQLHINKLSLKLYGNINININELFKQKLNNKCPLSIITYKEKKIIKKYKIYKEYGIPIIKQDTLNNIISTTKNIIYENILYKF